MDAGLTGIEAVFIDLDGTLYLGQDLFPGVLDFLGRVEGRGIARFFLSNNSSQSKQDYVTRLSVMGIDADADEILRWMSAGPAPEMTYLTHGELVAADTLRFRVEHELERPVRVPEHLESVYLDRSR